MMTTGHKKNQAFGFQKGFLLPSSNTKGVRGKPAEKSINPVVLEASGKKEEVSTALLDLEDRNVGSRNPNVLKFAQDAGFKRIEEKLSPSFPLYLNLSHDEESPRQDNEVTIQEGSSKPLIQELRTEGCVDDSRSGNLQREGYQHSPMIKEIYADNSSSVDKVLGMKDVASSMPTISNVVGNYQSTQGSEQSMGLRVGKSREPTENLDSPVVNLNTLLVLKKELNRLLVQRRGYREFVSNQLKSPEVWRYMWTLVLPRVPREDAALDLGVIMMENDEQCILVECTVDENADKTLLLGAVLLLSHLAREDNRWFQEESKKREILQARLLPRLVTLVQGSAAKRTVLAQESMLAGYGLLVCSDDFTNSQLQSSFIALLRVHEAWLVLPSRKDSWKRRCTLAMVQDWLSYAGSDEQLLFPIKGMGGIQQAFLETQQSLETIKLFIEIDDATSNRRGILRGMLAAFGRDTKLFSRASLEVCIPKLLHSAFGEGDSGTRKATLSFLVILFQAYNKEHLDHLIKLIIDSLIENKADAAEICQPWRESLHNDLLVEEGRYALVLESVCKCMLESPDQVEILALFGILVDVSGECSQRIVKGIMTVLTVCSHGLTKVEGKNLCERLAPLLLIRRVPSTVYRTIWDQDTLNWEDFQDVLSRLVHQLKEILGSNDLTPSERKLAAGIVGLKLPFMPYLPCSTFTAICLPAFQALVSVLKDTSASSSERAACYGPAKNAIYIACCNVSFMTDGDVAQATASFALWLLEPHNRDAALIQCQTGCIEFFAACLQASSTEGILSKMTQALQGILCDNADSLNEFRSDLFEPLLLPTVYPSVKICVWNSYLLVSQRISEGPALKKWAKVLGPWLLKWIEGDEEPSAALQILGVLVTRTKSLTCFGNQLIRVNRSARRTMQLQGCATISLKLLLSIMMLDVDRYQSLGEEAEETISVIAKVAANGDADEEFKDLARLFAVA